MVLLGMQAGPVLLRVLFMQIALGIFIALFNFYCGRIIL